MHEREVREKVSRDIDAEVGRRSGRRVPTPFEGSKVNQLPVQVAFVVPSTRAGEDISKSHFDERIEFTRDWFSSRFGGDTTVRASGGYIGEDGDLVKEAVAVVESSTTIESYLDTIPSFREFIRERRRNWKQDTVAYKVEGQTFIYPERPYIDDEVTIPENVVNVE